MSENTFDRDLESGDILEYHILKSIQKKYPRAIKRIGYFKGYDLYVPETNTKIEVKRDYKSKHTGNFVVEIEFNGKPSALATTEANYWVFADKEHLYWIAVGELRKLVKEHPQLNPVSFTGKGDDRAKRAYLVPVSLISRYSDMVTPNDSPYKPQSPL
jgi:hypothetical protein